jgi:hypothetical protein
VIKSPDGWPVSREALLEAATDGLFFSGTDRQMKKAPSYVVYFPPMDGFPYLAVISRDSQGNAIRLPAQDAAAYNKKMAKAEYHSGTVKKSKVF